MKYIFAILVLSLVACKTSKHASAQTSELKPEVKIELDNTYSGIDLHATESPIVPSIHTDLLYLPRVGDPGNLMLYLPYDGDPVPAIHLSNSELRAARTITKMQTITIESCADTIIKHGLNGDSDKQKN